MLTTADMGIGTAPRAMKTHHVKVLRAFIWQGVPTTVGEIVELPAGFALEMVSYNKAVRVEAPAEPADVPASPPARGRKKE